MNKKYDKLFDIKDNNEFCSNIDLMDEVYEKIAMYYQSIGVTRVMTLASKIMLGVYGCIPAFDNNVNNTLAILQSKSSTVFKKKIELLSNYISHNPDLDQFIKMELGKHPAYTYMRILDDFLWNY